MLKVLFFVSSLQVRSTECGVRVSGCDFKGVCVLREAADRSVAVQQCVSVLIRSVTISSAVDAHTRPPRSRRCAPERWEVQPPSFATPRRERSIISVACSRLTSTSVMFFPATEAETRQKLLRNVKKEVGRLSFLPRSQLVFAGAVRSRPCVFVWCRRGLFTMTLGTT